MAIVERTLGMHEDVCAAYLEEVEVSEELVEALLEGKENAIDLIYDEVGDVASIRVNNRCFYVYNYMNLKEVDTMDMFYEQYKMSEEEIVELKKEKEMENQGPYRGAFRDWEDFYAMKGIKPDVL